MTLKSISAKNLKGLTFSHALGPVTMIIGPNASGKTARLDAIRLALLGYAPGLGDRADKVFQLSGGDTMEVSVMTDDGKLASRTWRRKGDSIQKVQSAMLIPNLPNVLLDPAEYFALSSDKRTDYVFNRVKIDTEKFSIKTLLKRLKALETPTAAHQAAMTVCMNDLDFASQDANQSVQDVLQGEIRSLTETMKVQRANLDRMTKTLAGMTELDLKSASQLTESLPSLNTKIAELEKELQELSLQRDRLEQLQKKIKGDPVRESIALRDKINELESKLESQVLLPDPSEQLEAAITKRFELRTQIVADQSIQQHLRQKAQVEQEKIAKKKAWQEEILSYEEKTSVIPDLQRQIEKLKPSVEGYKSAYSLLVSAKAVLNTRLKSQEELIAIRNREIADIEARMAKFLAQEYCPTCHANTPGWQDRVKDDFAAQIENAKQHRSGYETERAAISEQIAAASETEEDAKRQDAEHTTRQNALQSLQNRLGDALLAQNKVDRLQSAINALGAIQDYSEAIAECEANLKELREKTVAAEAKVKELEGAKLKFQSQQVVRASNQATIYNLKTQLASLGSIIEEMKGLGVPTLQDLSDAIHNSKHELEHEQRELLALNEKKNLTLASQQDIERHKAAEREREKAEAEFEVLKTVRETVKEFLGEIVSAAWGPILERANAIAAPILKTKLSINDNQLGRWTGAFGGGQWIDTSTFSGTEQAITYAALSVALAQDSPFKLICVDEMGRMDDNHRRSFLENIIKLQKDGAIDQFVGVHAGDATRIPEGVTIINLNQ